MPAGMIARLARSSRRARRRSAEPSRPRPTRRRARRPCRPLVEPAPAPCGSSAPRTRTGRRLPRLRGRDAARPARPRASCRNARPRRPSSAGRPCLVARLGRGAGRPAREDEDDQRQRRPRRGRRRRRAGDASRDTCARGRRTSPSRRRTSRRSCRKTRVREPGREQEDEPAVDRDRRRRVTGRVAGVDRQALETNDARPMRVDSERRGCGTTPTRRRARTRRTPRSATSASAAQTSAIDPTTIGSTTPPATIEPISEASVRDDVRCAASQPLTRSSAAPMPQAGSSTRVTSNPQADREHRDRGQTGEHHDDEDDRGGAPPTSAPAARPRPPCVRKGRARPSLRPTRDGRPTLGRMSHGCVSTCMMRVCPLLESPIVCCSKCPASTPSQAETT